MGALLQDILRLLRYSAKVTNDMNYSTGPALLTTDEAAAYLNVSPRLVRKLMQTRALPSVKIGRLTRIAPTALDDYLSNHTRPAVAPHEGTSK